MNMASWEPIPPPIPPPIILPPAPLLGRAPAVILSWSEHFQPSDGALLCVSFAGKFTNKPVSVLLESSSLRKSLNLIMKYLLMRWPNFLIIQIMDEVQEALQKRYSHLHPLIFQRSLEKATSNGELFDILESIPDYPIVWDEKIRRWVKTEDLLQSKAKEKERRRSDV